MSNELIGKVPFWIVKFALNNIVRKKMMQYNEVVLPEDESKWKKMGNLSSSKVREHDFQASLDDGELQIRSVGNGMINVRISKDLSSLPQTDAVVLENKTPPALVIKKEKEKITISQESGSNVFIIIEIDLKNETITFEDGFGFRINIEEFPSYHEQDWYKLERYPEVTCANYYGYGEKGGPLDKKGETISFWNTDSFAYSTKDTKLYQSQPMQIVVRSNGFCYAVVFDNPNRSQIKIGDDEDCSTKYYVNGGGINYYLIVGPTVNKVFSKLADLLGRAPLPPISALGHHQSRWSYYPESAVRELAFEFRNRKIPCDYIHLDIDYMDNYRIFTWNKEHFPNPKKLSEDLLNQGFRLMAMTDPGIKVDSKYKIYKEGIKGGHFCLNPDGSEYIGPVWPGDCHFPDFTQAKTREWFGSHFTALTDVGISGFWIDMNDPSIFNDKGTIDDDVIHPGEGEPRQHKEVHNEYAHLMAKATYEGLQKIMPNKRIYINSRSAYLGSHRYAGTWTGDNVANWKHLQISIPMLLNMAASGQVMIGPDIGGFARKPGAELLIRWYQAGCLYPYFRNHTINKKCSQEPWVHGKKTETIIRKTIQLRYSLMVYIYTSIRQSCLTGVPAFRALWVDHPKDPMVHIAEWSETEYLFGDNLLVAPILKKGKRKRAVYLPQGKWFSLCGELVFEGGKVHDIDIPLDVTPIFVKEGSIIPYISKPI
ncbi:MAG: hypothetical protein KGD64_11095, partial [Candidatus Heimdallarchaeota archaeon]|nr:hypothetical protein [Candidatus Heimdallarchaeota archaeon]